MVVAMLVVLLAGLVFPITLLLAAIVFDIGVVAWAIYRYWTDRLSPAFARVVDRVDRVGRAPQRPRPAIG